MRRRKMSKRSSRKNFKRGATRINGKNATRKPMRGGYRL